MYKRQSYPSGHWLFGFASKKYHPLEDLDKVAWKLKGSHTKYYEPRLHAGVFALPAYVEELLEDVYKRQDISEPGGVPYPESL